MSKQVVSKVDKERTRLLQEKCQAMLNDMLRDDDNKYCEDCDAKGPRWASWNLGIFLCIRCAGIHRNLGVHISKVKSVNLDTWTPEQVVSMTSMGNSRARAVYEANLPDNFRRPQTDVALENFIRAKFEHKKYIAKEWTPPPPTTKVDWSTEIDELIRNKKKPNNNNSSQQPPLFHKLKTTTATAATPHVAAAAPQPLVEDLFSSDLAQVFINSPPPSSSASDDLSDLTNNTATSLQQEQESSLASSSLAGLDLSQKMTKESILSLYGQQSQQTFQPPQQQQQNMNPFINPPPQQLSHGLLGLSLSSSSNNPPQQQQQQQPLQMFPTNPLHPPPQQNNFWK